MVELIESIDAILRSRDRAGSYHDCAPKEEKKITEPLVFR
jgi:hypothetical protein